VGTAGHAVFAGRLSSDVADRRPGRGAAAVTTALVIGRRRPGRPIGRTVKETVRRLEGAGWTANGALVTAKKDVRRRTAKAVDDGIDVVIAVGGDGVVLQVVQELAETPVALGIIPMGTGNLCAGNLGIPKKLDDAVDVLLGGARRRIDLGRARIDGKHWFFSVACGIGFDAEVMQATSKPMKRRWGKLAYVANALRQSRRLKNVAHEITIDGATSTMQATQVFVANFGRMGLAMKPRLDIEPDDGLLDLMVIEASSRFTGLRAGWEALRQDDEGESDGGHAFRSRARKVRIAAEPSRLVELDGSVIGATPVKVSVRPGALNVVVPAPPPDAALGVVSSDAASTEGSPPAA
jgi:YegS/Rv2252/BmrU family lipid kinase